MQMLILCADCSQKTKVDWHPTFSSSIRDRVWWRQCESVARLFRVKVFAEFCDSFTMIDIETWEDIVVEASWENRLTSDFDNTLLLAKISENLLLVHQILNVYLILAFTRFNCFCCQPITRRAAG